MVRVVLGVLDGNIPEEMAVRPYDVIRPGPHLLSLMGVVIASFNKLGFFSMSLIPSLTFLSVLVTNDFLEDMISVLDLLYPVYYKTKVIVPAI